MKTCTKCKEVKKIEEFNKDKRKKDGLTCHCKSCVRAYTLQSRLYTDLDYRNTMAKKWKLANPQKVRAQWIQQIYKLSWDTYEYLFYEQSGACAICSTPLKLHAGIEHGVEVAVVDHNHTTGKVRGLLCTKCNTALGLLKDSPSILHRAQIYLETNNE